MLQAKVLIHEGLYRGRPSSDLKYILQLESALNTFFSGTYQKAEDLVRKDLVSAQIAAYNLNLYNKSEVFAAILITTFSTYASSLTNTNGYKFNRFVGVNIDAPINNIFNEFSYLSYNATKNPILTINEQYVLANSHLDSRTAVMLLNLNSPLKLKLYSHASDNALLTEKIGFSIYLYDKSEYYYTFADPQNLNLLLPK